MPLSAEMSPQDILSKADEARGNLEGIEWKIRIVSLERGRTQKRTLIVKARDFNSLAEFTAPAKVKGQKVLTEVVAFGVDMTNAHRTITYTGATAAALQYAISAGYLKGEDL